MIPKADGSQRPLGIPTIRDRVAQMAVKLVIEKPCALIAHARFDEGRQAKACSLLSPLFLCFLSLQARLCYIYV